ncbi:hypothetical protein [Orientia tsutsugamushi]|nr:hypothetical protein [Orientia tsutsugamushi]
MPSISSSSSFTTPVYDKEKYERHTTKGLQEIMYNYDYVIY